MDATLRRNGILQQLTQSTTPVSATTLAKEFQVSRQVIVGDIALLRAAGHDVLATPRGYLMSTPRGGVTFQVACLHTFEQTRAELYAVVDRGGEVIDVSVDHPVYGELTGNLHISSRYDVEEFLKKSSAEGVRPLSHLTDGVHLHRISCINKEVMALIMQDLVQIGVSYGK